jgi:hypothetical protein
MIKLPGDVEVTIECLPGSTLPGELQALGYDATEIGEGERILAAAIIQQFTPGLVSKLSRAVTFY